MTPNIKPPSNLICLHRAAAQNNYKAVKNLIDLGADVNAICHYPPQKFNYNANCTALHVAIANGSKRIVQLLINNNADVNIEANCEDEDCKYSGTKEYFNRTPLLIAIDQGNREIVELLIRNHADINFITTAGESAFGLALKNDNNELIQLLLDAGVDINLHSNNVTSLHWAVARNNYPIAEYLINKGADVNSVCHYPPRECFNTCCSALHVAVKNKNKDMIELLLKNNADVNIKANCDETTPCHFPVRDYFNRTPLHIAVDKEDKEVVKLLIKNKADVNIGTRTGETALGIAVKKNNFTLVKLLLDADADINSFNESPLHLAVKQRHSKMAEYLLNRGADFNIKDSDGAVINLQCVDDDIEVVIKRHIVKLKAANLYAGSYLFEIGDGFDCLYEECYHEIELMRKTYIGKSNLTFYNLLTMCQHKLALRLKHVDANCAGSVFKETARSKFPLYGEMARHNFAKAIQRKKLLNKCNDIIVDIFCATLPSTFIRKLFNYLSNKDLKILS